VRLSDPGATNWSFSCLTDSGGTRPPAGGLVLQEVQHDGHNFARDIRVIGFWVEIETVRPTGTVASTTSSFYVLDSPPFTVSPLSVLRPVPTASPTSVGGTFNYLREADAALDFREYFKDSTGNYVAFGVKGEYQAPAFFAGFTNCELAGLTVEQIFLFSRYGNSPVHEPSGALNAARCHPIVKYTTIPNGSVNRGVDYTRVKSIRFDYRLHLYIDRHHDVATNATLAQLGNQAGLFADSDTLSGTVITAIGSTLWNLSTSAGVSSGSFDAVEKPLVLEVTAPGLANGFPMYRTMPPNSVTVRSWDNVHWWGARGPGAPIISTPGAFHAAHMHWRWGGAAKPVAGNPRFHGNWPSGQAANPVTNGMWGPVVDPNIWMQTIRLAVVKNEARLDPTRGASASSLSRADWKTLFDPGLRATPDAISSGADIVLWFSVEVPREVTVPGFSTFTPPSYTTMPTTTYTARSPGTILISGIFFAHDAEQTGFLVGSTSPAYRPRDEATIRSGRQWFRPAS